MRIRQQEIDARDTKIEPGLDSKKPDCARARIRLEEVDARSGSKLERSTQGGPLVMPQVARSDWDFHSSVRTSAVPPKPLKFLLKQE